MHIPIYVFMIIFNMKSIFRELSLSRVLYLLILIKFVVAVILPLSKEPLPVSAVTFGDHYHFTPRDEKLLFRVGVLINNGWGIF